MVEKLQICEKVNFGQLLDMFCFYYSFTLDYCVIFNLNLDATIRVSNSLDPEGFSAKTSSMKNQNFYTIKIPSTKATVWLENDLQFFGNNCPEQIKHYFSAFK